MVCLTTDKASETVIEACCIKKSIGILIKHSFGNYVVQKALKMSKEEERVKILELINKNLSKLTNKKVANKKITIKDMFNSTQKEIPFGYNPNFHPPVVIKSSSEKHPSVNNHQVVRPINPKSQPNQRSNPNPKKSSKKWSRTIKKLSNEK